MANLHPWIHCSATSEKSERSLATAMLLSVRAIVSLISGQWRPSRYVWPDDPRYQRISAVSGPWGTISATRALLQAPRYISSTHYISERFRGKRLGSAQRRVVRSPKVDRTSNEFPVATASLPNRRTRDSAITRTEQTALILMIGPATSRPFLDSFSFRER